MSYRSDPTANQALGSVQREWKQMARLALKVRQSGDSAVADQERRRFIGIYRRLLIAPLEEVRSIAR